MASGLLKILRRMRRGIFNLVHFFSVGFGFDLDFDLDFDFV